MIKKSWFVSIALVSTLTLSGCGAMNAQNPGGSYSPVNAISMDGRDSVLLFGADVVSYFTDNQYVQGKPSISSTNNGVTVYFSTEANKALFDANPSKYLPQYGGYCANGIQFGIPWGGNAQDFLVHNDKLYIFGGAMSKAAFELELEKSIELSDQYWQEEIAGNNSFIQRAKRLTVRVPHYQTGEEQAEAVKAAQGK